MARVKQPVKIDGIEFDALISSDHKLESTVPEYAVEAGYSVSDAIILGAETLSLVVFLTDTPVTWKRRSGHGTGHTEATIKKLKDLYRSRKLITVVTSEQTYTNMAIESITISKSLETGYSREIPISFRQVRTASTLATVVPEEYGKSGATQQPVGTASTTAGSADESGSSGGGSGGGSYKRSASTDKNKKLVDTGTQAVNVIYKSGRKRNILPGTATLNGKKETNVIYKSGRNKNILPGTATLNGKKNTNQKTESAYVNLLGSE